MPNPYKDISGKLERPKDRQKNKEGKEEDFLTFLLFKPIESNYKISSLDCNQKLVKNYNTPCRSFLLIADHLVFTNEQT